VTESINGDMCACRNKKEQKGFGLVAKESSENTSRKSNIPRKRHAANGSE